MTNAYYRKGIGSSDIGFG